jgi:hypothetical protein
LARAHEQLDESRVGADIRTVKKRWQWAFLGLAAIAISCGRIGAATIRATEAVDAGSEPLGGGQSSETDAGTAVEADAGQYDAGLAGEPEDAGLGTNKGTQLTTGESASRLALDDSSVYWLNLQISGGVPGRYELRAMPKTGGTPVTLATGPGGWAGNLVVDSRSAYFVHFACTPPCNYPGAGNEWYVARVSKPGGAAQELGLGHGDVALDQANVYLQTFDGLASYPQAGGARSLIASSNRDGAAVAVDDDFVYWSNEASGPDIGTVVYRTPKAGGTSTFMFGFDSYTSGLKVSSGNLVALLTGGPRPGLYVSALAPATAHLILNPSRWINGFDVSRGVVYWTQDHIRADPLPGCLGRVNLDGTGSRCLDEGPRHYRGVRADDRDLFFIRDGQIVRLARE